MLVWFSGTTQVLPTVVGFINASQHSEHRNGVGHRISAPRFQLPIQSPDFLISVNLDIDENRKRRDWWCPLSASIRITPPNKGASNDHPTRMITIIIYRSLINFSLNKHSRNTARYSPALGQIIRGRSKYSDNIIDEYI